MAGTGLERQRRFLKAFEPYRDRYRDWFVNAVDDGELRRIKPAKYGVYTWDISALPRFAYSDSWPEEGIQGALVDYGFLAVWAALLFAAAFVVSLRYDVR